MSDYSRYSPYICIGMILFILFVLWFLYSGKDYQFIGFTPVDHNTQSSYNWEDVTPAEPLIGEPSYQESERVVNPDNIPFIDNTPIISPQFQDTLTTDNEILELNNNVCTVPEIIEAPVIPTINYTIKLPETNNEVDVKPKKRGRFVSKGEKKCCDTLERIYGAKFTSTWPTWLRNPETNRTLELDCYNDDLKIAVEYNGIQHYKWPNFTNQSYQEFINQVRRDTLKANLCDKHGVYLITVPYNVPHDKIPAYITSYLPETIRKRLYQEQTFSI